MAGLMSHQEAREYLDRSYLGFLERHLSKEKSSSTLEKSFVEWEDLAEEFSREMGGRLLEVLAMMSGAAQADEPGPCPHCRSGQVRWLDREKQKEWQSRHGPVVLPRQTAQCRSCGRAFSPSGSGVEG